MVGGVNEDHIFDRGVVALASKAHDKAFLFLIPLWYFAGYLNNLPKRAILPYLIKLLQIHIFILICSLQLVVCILLIFHVNLDHSITCRTFYLGPVANCSRQLRLLVYYRVQVEASTTKVALQVTSVAFLALLVITSHMANIVMRV